MVHYVVPNHPFRSARAVLLVVVLLASCRADAGRPADPVDPAPSGSDGTAEEVALEEATLDGPEGAPEGDGETKTPERSSAAQSAAQAPPPIRKAKPSWSGKALWAAMSREGGCVDLEHVLDVLPELEEDPEPHALVARLKRKGVEASAEDVAKSEGRMVKVTVPSRGLAMAFVQRASCREFHDPAGGGSPR